MFSKKMLPSEAPMSIRFVSARPIRRSHQASRRSSDPQRGGLLIFMIILGNYFGIAQSGKMIFSIPGRQDILTGRGMDGWMDGWMDGCIPDHKNAPVLIIP